MFKMYTMQVIELKIRDEDSVIIHIDGYGSYCISETFYKQLISFYRIKQTDQVASSIMPVNSKYWVPSATICKIYPKHFQSVIKFLNNVEQIKAADGNGVYELGINGFIEQLKKDKEKMPKKLFNIYVAFTDGLAYVRINARVSYVILRSDWDALTSLYSVNLAEIIDLNNDKLKSNEVLYKANLNQLDDLVKFLKRHDLELNKESSENEFTVIIKKKDGGRVTTEEAEEAFRQLGSNVRKMEKYQRVLRDAQDLVNSYHDGVPLKFLQTHLMNIEELGKEIGFNGSNDD